MRGIGTCRHIRRTGASEAAQSECTAQPRTTHARARAAPLERRMKAPRMRCAGEGWRARPSRRPAAPAYPLPPAAARSRAARAGPRQPARAPAARATCPGGRCRGPPRPRSPGAGLRALALAHHGRRRLACTPSKRACLCPKKGIAQRGTLAASRTAHDRPDWRAPAHHTAAASAAPAPKHVGPPPQARSPGAPRDAPPTRTSRRRVMTAPPRTKSNSAAPVRACRRAPSSARPAAGSSSAARPSSAPRPTRSLPRRTLPSSLLGLEEACGPGRPRAQQTPASA